MTSILEKLIAVLAPHHCILCSNENNIVCSACLNFVFTPPPLTCAFCGKQTPNFAICRACTSNTALSQLYIVTAYDGLAAEVIQLYKFARARAAATVLAAVIVERLPLLPATLVVTHVPTAASRVRQRGYDHAKLLAQAVAKQINRPHCTLLQRKHSHRQLGANRRVRVDQAATAYVALHSSTQPVLLVDDVLTTGATVQAATSALLQSGVPEIYVAVIAKQAAHN